MNTQLTGHIGLKQLDERKFRAIHAELGIKAYGKTETDALRHLAKAMETHTGEVING